MISRRKERALLSQALQKDNVQHESLAVERRLPVQLALKTPASLPTTPKERAADRQRRDEAMMEVNVSEIFYTPRFRCLAISFPRTTESGKLRR